MSSVDKLTELLELLFFCNSDSKELSLFISEHVFTKKELKISAFSLKLVTNCFHVIVMGYMVFYYYSRTFLTQTTSFGD